jgi:ubiquinone/menaquinone biosynthesis C-methylase UbiE
MGAHDMSSQKYLHGFNRKEQTRLLHQARFLEPYIYRGVDLEFKENILEVGCGVGAQTQILCRRFPDLKITGVDLSDEQLAVARQVLKKQLKSGQVTLLKQDAQTLHLAKKDYDGAFLCWLLEHVPDPVKVLKGVRKHLKRGATVYLSEVFNQTLFLEPYSPAFIKYWFEFNDLQNSIKGHPFIGAQLGHLLKAAGFVNIQTEVRSLHFDSREPEKRAAFTDYFYNILLSAETTLLESGRIDRKVLTEMKREVERVKKACDAVFFYAYIRATADVP